MSEAISARGPQLLRPANLERAPQVRSALTLTLTLTLSLTLMAGRVGAAREPTAAARGTLLRAARAGRLRGDGPRCGQCRAHLKHELRLSISRAISRVAVRRLRRGRARGRRVAARARGVRRAALARWRLLAAYLLAALRQSYRRRRRQPRR